MQKNNCSFPCNYLEVIMPTLTVNNFSCLTNLVFKLEPINIIIGAQGSGKSITAKLFYFFSELPRMAIEAAAQEENMEQFKKSICKKFYIWFPASAWGNGRFNIGYVAGDFNVRVLRRLKGNKPSEEISIKFSDSFSNFYKYLSEMSKKESKSKELSEFESLDIAMEWNFRFRDLAMSRLSKSLGSEFLYQQTFIPAGRAFFTSIGRLVAGFEQAASLDPVTITFARMFASIRDISARRVLFKRPDNEYNKNRKNIMKRLFGGELIFEKEMDFIKTDDGRKIPFSALSSGQQELLPMWSFMDYLAENDQRNIHSMKSNNRRSRHELVYIEEPEAHLFPSAQSLLMDFLIGTMARGREGRSLIITTHSPYIMSKINVFLKAGQLSRRKKRNEKINEVVPRECWIHENNFSALAMEDGELKNLLDGDGLIDGSYLDSISEDISYEFSRLLSIESEIEGV